MDPDPAQLEKNPDPTLIRNEEKNMFIFKVDMHKIRSYKPSFKLEFVNSGFFCSKMKTVFINPLLQVGSGSNEKVMDPDSADQKSTDPTGSLSLI